MDLMHKKYLVVGAGVSGVAATELLLKKGCEVLLYDGNASFSIDAFRGKHPELSNVPILAGELPEGEIASIDVAVLSPGVPTDLPLCDVLREKGIAIWGEIELAYAFGKGRVAAITGTNGKTTTTTLVGQIMKLYFEDVKVVGNIGIPYTSVAADTTEDTVVVAEISSFQLETVHTFAPRAAAILNITPDHLNRHHTMEAYIAAKERIAEGQSVEDFVVLNYEDEVLRAFGESCVPRVVWFSSSRKLADGLYVEDGVIYWARDGKNERIIATDKLNILGSHNHENVMAAVALADGFGVPMDTIRQGLRDFHAVEHRIEFVCEKRGVAYYDDSKGTNPDAAIKGICAMNRQTILIGGGYDKESSYDEWIESFGGKVKKLILIGQTREKIADCCKKHGFDDYCFAESLDDAMDQAVVLASPGEAVLLSPACASWGMFDNYEQRGDLFKEYARNIKE